MSNESPLRYQAGAGNPTHYTRWKIQPIEFWMKNNWDACSGSSLKYICRHDAKDGIEAFRKARHFMQLRVDLHEAACFTPINAISMDLFIGENRIQFAESQVLRELDLWVRSGRKVNPQFFTDLDSLMQIRYPA